MLRSLLTPNHKINRDNFRVILKFAKKKWYYIFICTDFPQNKFNMRSILFTFRIILNNIKNVVFKHLYLHTYKCFKYFLHNIIYRHRTLSERSLNYNKSSLYYVLKMLSKRSKQPIPSAFRALWASYFQTGMVFFERNQIKILVLVKIVLKFCNTLKRN